MWDEIYYDVVYESEKEVRLSEIGMQAGIG